MRTLIFINLLLLRYHFIEVSREVKSLNENAANHICKDEIPLWVKQLYELNNDEFINDAIPVVTFFNELSDSTSYCLYKVDDGVCQITFVATQKHKKKYMRLRIGNECDEDFANPIYSYTSYQHDSTKRSFEVTTTVEKAKPKYLTEENGKYFFKKGFNMENAETTTSSISKTVSINRSGNIITKKKNSR